MTTKDLSPRALDALDKAKALAREEGAPCCTTGYLIYGLTADHLSLGNRIFDDVNIYPEMFRDHLKKLPAETDPGNKQGLHPLTVLAIERGRDARKQLGDSKVVTTDHIMLGLLSIKEGSAYECLREFSVEPDEIAKELIEALGFEIESRPTW